MMTHELKTWVPYFQDVKSGKKKFEIRINDRDYKLGDTLILKEYDDENYTYTGDELAVKVIYTLHGGNFGVQEGYVLMGIE